MTSKLRSLCSLAMAFNLVAACTGEIAPAGDAAGARGGSAAPASGAPRPGAGPLPAPAPGAAGAAGGQPGAPPPAPGAGSQTGAGPSSDPGAGPGPAAPTRPEEPPPSMRDSDADGVMDDRDLCPATAAGVAVDRAGCAPAATIAPPAPWGRPVSAAPPAPAPVNGAIEANGFQTFVIDARSKFPKVLRTLASQVKALPRGFDVKGSILVDTPAGPVVLGEAEVLLEYGADSSNGIERVRGRVRAPFADFGMPDQIQTESPVAEIGLDTAENLKHLNAPLAADRRYFYFRFSTKMEVKAGPLVISAPGGTETVIAFDPSDPFFFMRADLSGIPELGDVLRQVGIGVSRQGLLPFSPQSTWGLERPIGFSGQLYLLGSAGLKIPRIPVTLVGTNESVLDLEPGDDGKTMFSAPGTGLRLGANPTLGIELEVIPSVASLEFEVGKASVALELVRDQERAAFSGELKAGQSLLSELLGVTPTATLKAAGMVSRQVAQTYLKAHGDLALELSKLGALTGLALQDLSIATADLRVDRNGLVIKGRAGGSFLGSLGVTAGAAVDVLVPGDVRTTPWYVKVNGDLAVHGVRLGATAMARLSSAGVRVEGRVSTPLGGIAMTGDVNRAGANIGGGANVSIPVVAPKEVVQTVTNGAICGYETVTDGAKCGWDTVAGCIVSFFQDCKTARSCPDYSKPLSCPQRVTVPDYNWGTVRGTAALRIGTSGLSGSMSGQFCPPTGGCVSILSGRVDTQSWKACATVPGVPGEFCAKL